MTVRYCLSTFQAAFWKHWPFHVWSDRIRQPSTVFLRKVVHVM